MLSSTMPFYGFTPDSVDTVIERAVKTGLDRLYVGAADQIWESDDIEAKLQWFSTVISRIREAGIEPAIWCGGLGYGPPRSERFLKMFPDFLNIEGFNGNKNYAVCVLDKKFREAYCSWVAAYAKSGAALLMIDDDFVLSARNVLGCACREHLKLLSERAGYEVTHEDLRKAFSGKPNKLRSLFLEVQGKTVMDFCREIRAAADSVSPDFRIGFCASYTHFDIEGVDIKEMLSVLAGRSRPLLRLSGATYWYVRASRLYPGKQTIGAIMETVRSQRAYFDGFDVELLDENDPCPREHRVVPASLVQLYDRISIADGIETRFKYMFQYSYCSSLTSSGDFYQRAHLRDMAFDSDLAEMFRGGDAVGWRVKQEQQVMRNAVLPEEYAGDGELMSWGTQSRAGAFLTGNTQSTTYTGTGGPVAAFWENARYLTADDLNCGVLIDITAAQILIEKGVDVGLRKAEPADSISGEVFHDCGMSFRNLWEERGKFFKVTLDPRAEVLSSFRSGDDEFPACYFYTNAAGQRFAVYTFDSNSLHYTPTHLLGAIHSPRRRQQLDLLYQRLCGNHAPVTACNDISHEFYMLAKRNAKGNLAILFCNIYADTADLLDFKLAVPGEIIKTLHGEANITGDMLHVADIPPYGWCAVEIRDI